MRHSNLLAAALVVTSVAAAPLAASAQPEGRQGRARGPVAQPVVPVAPSAPEPPALSYQSPASANDTRNELQQLLQDYPPSVRVVLQADPSLLESQDYLAPYPRLRAFIQQHPEVIRNPAFFFGQFGQGFYERGNRDPKVAAMDTLENVLAGAAIFTGFVIAIALIWSLLRELIQYRRWLRHSRIQTEANTKILDRLATNEDLLAYIQTPAGSQFLKAVPASIEIAPPSGIPIGRILWSVQAGVVLVALGIGIWMVRGSVMDELMPAFIVIGTVAISVGFGFIISAAIAYTLTSRLAPTPAPEQP
jgi:hypothetical protein